MKIFSAVSFTIISLVVFCQKETRIVKHPSYTAKVNCQLIESENDPISYFLDSAANVLNNELKLSLRIEVYNDMRGNSEMKDKLSQGQADAVKYSFTKRKVETNKIVLMPKGKSEPFILISEDSLNYEKEIRKLLSSGKAVLLDYKFISTFKETDPELFEKLHALNRRTVFVFVNED